MGGHCLESHFFSPFSENLSVRSPSLRVEGQRVGLPVHPAVIHSELFRSFLDGQEPVVGGAFGVRLRLSPVGLRSRHLGPKHGFELLQLSEQLRHLLKRKRIGPLRIREKSGDDVGPQCDFLGLLLSTGIFGKPEPDFGTGRVAD